MELPPLNAHLERQQDAPPSNRERLSGLRTRVFGLFTGSSDLHAPHNGTIDDRPSKPNALRLGLRIFSSSPTEISQNRSEIAPARRAPSSTYSVIDSDSSPPATVRPFTPSSLQVPRNGSHQRTRSHPRPSHTHPQSRGSDTGPAVRVRIREPRRKREASRHRGRKCCGPVMKNKIVRKKMMTSLMTGFFLAIVLAIYLALAVSNAAAGQEFHVLLILVIMLLTVFFCHSTIRLCMLIMRPHLISERHSDRVPSRAGPLGYAQPEQPIPVVLARDEEIAVGNNENGDGSEHKKIAPPPPAYGLWRSSVRINPNMVYWQRANERPSVEMSERSRNPSDEDDRPTTANRPPSYISDDGVQYVIQAQPRSTVHEPLPIHPAERGRMTHIASP